jgi:hypothetical protein
VRSLPTTPQGNPLAWAIAGLLLLVVGLSLGLERFAKTFSELVSFGYESIFS